MATADATISLPEVDESISGARLPDGALASLVSDLGAADRDLGLRLLNGRPPDSPWWSLTLDGSELHGGGGGPVVWYEATGQLEPILIDGLGHPVVAAWTPASGNQRWYIVPDASDWHSILDWLLERALPEYVPGALRRARSPLAHDPALQTWAETAARRALDDLDATYAQERRLLEAQLEEARAEAEPMRNGLLYGAGAELEHAVATVLEAAGLVVVSLDELLGDTTSADLLASYGPERRLVEIKSASGNAGESLVGQLERHLQTWPQLRPDEPVAGGVLVVNHQYRLEPAERTPSVYVRQEVHRHPHRAGGVNTPALRLVARIGLGGHTRSRARPGRRGPQRFCPQHENDANNVAKCRAAHARSARWSFVATIWSSGLRRVIEEAKLSADCLSKLRLDPATALLST